MVNKKRKVPRIVRDIFIPIRFGVANVAVGALGTATQPLVPVGTQNPLINISRSMTRFAAPLTSVVGVGIVVRQLKKLERKKKRRRS